MLWGILDRRGVQGRMDTCICMAEYLCCAPKTIPTFLICYTPIQNKKFKKKERKKEKSRCSFNQLSAKLQLILKALGPLVLIPPSQPLPFQFYNSGPALPALPSFETIMSHHFSPCWSHWIQAWKKKTQADLLLREKEISHEKGKNFFPLQLRKCNSLDKFLKMHSFIFF